MNVSCVALNLLVMKNQRLLKVTKKSSVAPKPQGCRARLAGFSELQLKILDNIERTRGYQGHRGPCSKPSHLEKPQVKQCGCGLCHSQLGGRSESCSRLDLCTSDPTREDQTHAGGSHLKAPRGGSHHLRHLEVTAALLMHLEPCVPSRCARSLAFP